jgi:hypothetical protein
MPSFQAPSIEASMKGGLRRQQRAEEFSAQATVAESTSAIAATLVFTFAQIMEISFLQL